MPLRIQDYIASFPLTFPFLDPAIEPWTLTNDLSHFVERFTAPVDLSGFEKAPGSPHISNPPFERADHSPPRS